MPGGPAGLDDPADDELAALAAAGRVEDVEAVLAVLAALELVEDAVGVRPEALGAAGRSFLKAFIFMNDNSSQRRRKLEVTCLNASSRVFLSFRKGKCDWYA